MNAAEAPLRFPIIFYSWRDSRCYVENRLSTCCSMGLVKLWRKGVTIIDSAGARWKVTGVDVKGGQGPFWGWKIFLQRMVWVDIHIEYEGEATLSDARSLILKSVDAHSDFWDEVANVDWLKKRLGWARNIPSLIAAYAKADQSYEKVLAAMPDE
jgi:hypothetical protein